MRKWPARVITLGLLSVLLACGGKQDTVVTAKAPHNDTVCSLDGMVLADYPGPKGQIQYDNGETDYFCDTVELLSLYLQPEQQRRVRGVFVQDMAKADWAHPKEYWVDARQAFYVVGSKREGSMGPTLGSFALAADAARFAQDFGGKVFAFKDITPDTVRLDGGVLKDEKM